MAAVMQAFAQRVACLQALTRNSGTTAPLPAIQRSATATTTEKCDDNYPARIGVTAGILFVAAIVGAIVTTMQLAAARRAAKAMVDELNAGSAQPMAGSKLVWRYGEDTKTMRGGYGGTSTIKYPVVHLYAEEGPVTVVLQR
ncbi:hypothetical protein HDU89_008923 [Geranomyces variabilis]|nr:hypothetical protein HDU89_008923 [Geranomyces variabilis]